MTRPSLDEYFLRLATVVATRATCLRRSVGCVLIDKRQHVLATGYNGRPTGWPHCNEPIGLTTTAYPHACVGANAPSGTSLDACEAIHAEQNALLQCGNTYAIEACYVTTEPCVACAKLLLNTSCRRVIFAERYTQGAAASELFLRHGAPDRTWRHLSY